MAWRRNDERSAVSAERVALTNATVVYGRRSVLHDVTLSVLPSSLLEVRGPNGSGKTTLLRLLAGTCPPSAGSRVGVRPVAFVPPVVEPPPLPVRSWLRRCRDRRFPVSEALDVLELQGDVRAPLRSLSFGNFRKVLLADALSSTAPIVVIDEAREGLDDPGLLGLRELTRRAVRDGVAVVVADQDAHAVPVGTDMLTIDDGAVTIGRAARDQDEDVTVSLVGPSANAEDLLRRGAALGFRPTDAP